MVAVLDVGKIDVAGRLEEDIRIDGERGSLARAERAFGGVLGNGEVKFVAELPLVREGRSGVAAESLRRTDASESSTTSILLIARVRVVALTELFLLDLVVPVRIFRRVVSGALSFVAVDLDGGEGGEDRKGGRRSERMRGDADRAQVGERATKLLSKGGIGVVAGLSRLFIEGKLARELGVADELLDLVF